MMTLLLTMLVTGAAPEIATPDWVVLGADAEHVATYKARFEEGLRKQGLILDNVEVAQARVEVTFEQLPNGAFRGQARMISEPAGATLAQTTLDAKDEEALGEVLDTAASMLAAPLIDKPELPPFRPPPKVAVTPYWWVVSISGFVVGATGAGLLGAALRDQGATEGSNSVFTASGKASGPMFIAGWVCVGVGVATVLTGIVLAAPLKDYKPEVAIGPNGASVGLSGRF